MKSWCQAGGMTLLLGGAVMVQVFPEHEKAGNIILLPIVFPWVLEVAATRETFIVDVEPWWSVTVILYCPP